MVVVAAVLKYGIQSVTCFQRYAAAAAMVVGCGTDAVAVTTESCSSIEMMEGEEVAARCSVMPAPTLSAHQQLLRYKIIGQINTS